MRAPASSGASSAERGCHHGGMTEALTSSDVRTHNLGLVLSRLDREGPASRSELARATGLVPGAITALTAELIEAGLLRAAGPTAPSGRGRPQARLELDGSGRAVLGVHFSVDALRLRAVDLAGRELLLREEVVRFPSGDPGAVADLLAERIRSAGGALPPLVAIAVAVPGPVRRGTQRVPLAIDFGWVDVDLAGLLRERLGERAPAVRLVNDANAAAYLEFAELRARVDGATDAIYLKSDTGIGGGAVVGGELLLGAAGYAFEPGHVIVVPDGALCDCGRRGCLVTVAGPEVLLRAAGLEAMAAEAGMPAALDELVRRHRAGEPVARAVVEEACRWLRLSIEGAVALLQPQFVVLGGYLVQLVEELGALSGLALGGLGAGELRGADAVMAAGHGANAALDGALLVVRHELLADPTPLR